MHLKGFLAISLIVCYDAHTFKNINTFKIDNDDDKRLKDRRTRNAQVTTRKAAGMKIDAETHMMQMAYNNFFVFNV